MSENVRQIQKISDIVLLEKRPKCPAYIHASHKRGDIKSQYLIKSTCIHASHKSGDPKSQYIIKMQISKLNCNCEL